MTLAVKDTPSMERVAISQFCTSRWSMEQDAACFASLGFANIGLWRDKVSDFGEEATADLLYEFDLGVSSLSWAGGFTGSDGRRYCESVDDALQAVRTAARLEADCLVVHSGARNGHTRKHAQRLLRHALDCLVPVAEDFGVRLAVEPMRHLCGSAWTFLSDWHQAARIVADYPPSSVGLVLDLYHHGGDEALLNELEIHVPRIALVQLADRCTSSQAEWVADETCQAESDRRLLGAGDVPLEQWVQRLLFAGYHGKFEVELYGPHIEHLGYAEVLEQTMSMLQEEFARIATISEMS